MSVDLSPGLNLAAKFLKRASFACSRQLGPSSDTLSRSWPVLQETLSLHCELQPWIRATALGQYAPDDQVHTTTAAAAVPAVSPVLAAGVALEVWQQPPLCTAAECSHGWAATGRQSPAGAWGDRLQGGAADVCGENEGQPVVLLWNPVVLCV